MKFYTQYIFALLLGLFVQVSFGQVANDDCGSAQPITIPSSGTVCINGTTTNAVSNGGTNACDTGPAGNEVWFTYVTTGAVNNFTVTPNGASPISDIVITIHTAGCGALFIEGCESGVGAAAVPEAIGLTPGEQVWISIESNGTDGDFELCIESISPPGNPGNICAQATPLCRKEPFSYGTLNGYTSSGFKPTCFGSAVQRDIWFKFTVGQTGTLEWNATPLATQEFDWALYDITNGCPNNGTAPVSCNYYFSQPALGAEANPIGMGAVPAGADAGEFNGAVTVTAGRTYAIVIDNYSGNNGGFDFQWGGTFKMAPYSEFELSPYQACNELTTNFVNNSYGADTYAWTFGDGTTSNDENPPSKTYSTPGNYIVSLTTTTDQGCVHTVTKVAVVSAPIVTLTSNKDTICLGESVDLTGNATITALQNPIPFAIIEDANVNDNNPVGFSSVINVTGVFPTTINPGAGEVVEVLLNIDHTRVEDLDVSLKCPNGTTIDLTSDNGGAGDNYEQTKFSAGAPPITGGTAPFTGVYSPEQPFTTFNGCPVNGAWELIVVDDQAGQAPYFDEWGISFKNENSLVYSWEPAGEITNQADFDQTVTPTQTTTYTLEATDALGCTEIAEVTIEVEVPEEAGLDSTIVVCTGDGSLSLTSLLRDHSTTDGDFLDPSGNIIGSSINLTTAVSGIYSYSISGVHCPDDLAYFDITIHQSPDAEIFQDSTVCPGEIVNVTVNVTEGAAPYTLVLNINGTDSTFNLAGNNLTLPVTVDATNQIGTVQITDGTTPGCSTDLSDQITLDVFDPIVAVQTDMICSGDNQTYQIEITISGGDPNGYLVNGSSSGATFLSGPIPTGGNFSFLITDQNDCNPILIEGKEFCACISDAGTMEMDPLDICPGETAVAIEVNDSLMESDDVARYVLHDSPTNSIGTVYAWNNTPSFGYVPGLSYETEYYISRIIGDPEPGVPAEVDLDECYSLSIGTPVTFHQAPEGTITPQELQVCLGNPVLFDFIGTVGIEDFNLTYTLDGVDYDVSNLSGIDGFEITQDSNFTITWTLLTDEYCETVKNEVFDLVVMQAPSAQISGDSTLCETSQKATIDLTINTQGQGSLWDIDYTDGTTIFSETGITDGHIIPVDPIAGDTTVYSLVNVTDNSGSTCPGVVSGSANVIIYGQPQATIFGSPEFCEFDSLPIGIVVEDGYGPYNFVINTNGVPGTDTLVLNSDSSNLFISPAAGTHNYTIHFLSDQSTGCESAMFGQATADVFPAPKMDLTGLDTLCEQANPTLEMDFSNVQGVPPFTVYYNDGISNFQLAIPDLNDASTIVQGFFNGSQTTTIFSVDSIVDGSSAGCKGLANGVATLVVNPNPRAQISGNNLICLGESAPVIVSFFGNNTVTVDISGSDGSSYSISGDAGTTDSILVSPLASTTYSMTQVYDANTPSCSGSVSGTVTIGVNDIPTGSISINPDEICLGESLELTITGQADEDLIAYLSDDYGTQFVENVNQNPGNLTVIIPAVLLGNLGMNYFHLDSLVGKSSAGCSAYDLGSDSSYVNPLPELSMFFSDSIVCFGTESTLSLVAGPDLGPFTATVESPNGSQQMNLNQGQNDFPLTLDISSTYAGTSITNDRTGCIQSSTAEATLLIQNNPYFSGRVDSAFCIGQNVNLTLSVFGTPAFAVQFEDQFGTVYSDSISGNQTVFNLPSTQEGVFTYSNFQIQELNFPNCVNQQDTTFTVAINGNPEVDFDLSLDKGCIPLKVSFTNLTPANRIKDVEWNFGNGITSTMQNIDSLFYGEAGFYSVSLRVTSPEGCVGSITKLDTIEVFPSPIANFISNPNPATIRTPEIHFENTSFGAETSSWIFDELGSSTEKHPSFEFPELEDRVYDISLVVVSEDGCIDSIQKKLRIEGILTVNIPNSFTPDGDNVNPTFLPIIHGAESVLDKYEFIVYDRWGKVIFSSNTIGEGWDGTSENGAPVKNGVYIYQVKVQSRYSAEVQQFTGQVQLIK